MPKTFIINNQKDMEELKNTFSGLYIMKKNIQRQEGLKIINNIKDIDNSYTIVQELLQNPYTISERKINLRVYMLIFYYGGNFYVYLHDNGFMYYTKKPFIKNTIEHDVNITTGYIDRQVYIDNPLTHQDFRDYLDSDRKLTNIEKEIRKNGRISKFVFENIKQTITNMINAYEDILCINRYFKYYTMFQLFGIDVSISDNLEAHIMEVNKGPDLGIKDERDGNVKKKVVRDMLDIIGLININDNGFERIK